MYDVLIIGGGLVGSYAAYRLAQEGHQVQVLERKQHLDGKTSCTGIVSRECVDKFAIDKTIILRAVNKASLFSPSGKMLRVWREDVQAFILDRVALDVSLAERAQRAGVKYVLGCPAQSIEAGPNRVKVCASCGGKETTFEAASVVIASGFGSRLTGQLGLGRIGDFVAGAQAEVAAPEADEVEVYFGSEVAPGFFGWLVPTLPGMARVGLLSRRSPGLYLRKFMASLAGQGKIAATEAKFSYGGIPLKPLPRTYGERVLVVGDVAGQVKPTTGGGVYYGLLCADIGAETLHEALKVGDLSARKLALYEREWGKRLKQELRIGYRARRLFEQLNDGQVDHLFDIIVSRGIDKKMLQATDLSFDWHGKAALRLLGYDVASRVVSGVKLLFRTG